MRWAARPGLQQRRQFAPAAQAEAAHAEVGARGGLDHFLKGWQELLFDLVEDPWHALDLRNSEKDRQRPPEVLTRGGLSTDDPFVRAPLDLAVPRWWSECRGFSLLEEDVITDGYHRKVVSYALKTHT